MTALSILELVRVTEQTDARGALDNARDLAAHAERWGYRRIWVAEHHNMPGIASAATSIVLAHLAAGTKTIRVGAGGIMLPNHAPYVIAEQFGTLARLFPGPHRSRTRPRPRDRPAHAARFATRAGGGGNLSAGRSRAASVSRARRSRPAHPGGPGGRNGSAALDSRIEQFRRDARRRAGAALRLRLAFCPRTADPGAADLPLPLQAVRTARPALCDGRGQHHRRRDATRRPGGWRRPSRWPSPISSAARGA